VIARSVEPEALDALDAFDPVAMRSRRDLRRIHRVMRTRSMLVDGLAGLRAARPGAVLRILELGAGDGTLMLGVARTWAHRERVELVLLDRAPCVEAATISAYAQAGWQATVCKTDLAAWVAEDRAPGHWNAIVATLFLHHFKDPDLVALFAAVAGRTDLFFASEPRRDALALTGSRLVGCLGANAVTRADAVVGVRAGFADDELSRLWPAPVGTWRLDEYRAGLFSHCFRATRAGPADARPL
jgi:hypothetical protein